MPPPAAREEFFEKILKTPGYTQSHWNAVIRSAKADGEEIRTEIVVWPQLAVLENGRFRTISVRPLIETWVYRDGRVTFVSAHAASAKPAERP